MFTPVMNDVVSGLIAMLGDPKASKAKLEEIQKFTKDLDAATAKNTESSQALLAKQEELSNREEVLNAKELGSNKRDENIKAKIAEYDALNAQMKENIEKQNIALAEIGVKQSAINKNLIDIADTITNLDAKAANIANREAIIRTKETEVASLKSDLQAKLNQIKAISGA